MRCLFLSKKLLGRGLFATLLFIFVLFIRLNSPLPGRGGAGRHVGGRGGRSSAGISPACILYLCLYFTCVYFVFAFEFHLGAFCISPACQFVFVFIFVFVFHLRVWGCS